MYLNDNNVRVCFFQTFREYTIMKILFDAILTIRKNKQHTL